MGDWIESYLHFTREIPSPEILRKWSAISAVAGAMQRRVWMESSNSLLYPNLYILLVAPPGVGKSETIKRVGELWRATENLNVAPNSVTRAALLDVLARSTVKSILPSGDFQLFHGLNVAASEFGVLCPAHDLEFLNTLNDIFDNGPVFEEERRARKEQLLQIKFPILNILGGTQPGFLSELLPEQAWSMGFTSRLIMIYSAATTKLKLNFSQSREYNTHQEGLQKDLKTITQLYGAVGWDSDAETAFKAWYETNLQPVPTHSRMLHYNSRRLVTALKLLMISSVSRANDLRITIDDLRRTQEWMLEAEDKMPDIFRDMAGKSDKQVMDDLHHYMWRLYARDRKPLHESRVIGFLSSRVPSEKIMRVIEMTERTGLIVRAGDNFWQPGVADNIPGVE